MSGIPSWERLEAMEKLLMLATLVLLAGGCGPTVYFAKPGTADPVHVIKCGGGHKASAKETTTQVVGALIFTPVIPFASAAFEQEAREKCIAEATAAGYTQLDGEPECAYWRDNAKPGEEIKIRNSCETHPPAWATSGTPANQQEQR